LDALAVRFPAARISHIYASTEFGVGFSVTDCQEGFPASWLRGVHAIGKLDPENRELSLRKGDKWFATGDEVEEHNDRIFFCGRLNGSINVGGNKVMPEEVEQVILQYPGVLLASVSGQKSSVMGNLVQAEIVAHLDESTSQDFRKGLMDYCRKSLATYKVPAFIKIVDDITLSSSGKIVRNGGLA
jgi:acyl-CoA synthetase (AMP-forming)/AMP-acid ligase II